METFFYIPIVRELVYTRRQSLGFKSLRLLKRAPLSSSPNLYIARSEESRCVAYHCARLQWPSLHLRY
jgi:hypothetical protein